jgi:hypothetical protein
MTYWLFEDICCDCAILYKCLKSFKWPHGERWCKVSEKCAIELRRDGKDVGNLWINACAKVGGGLRSARAYSTAVRDAQPQREPISRRQPTIVDILNSYSLKVIQKAFLLYLQVNGLLQRISENIFT